MGKVSVGRFGPQPLADAEIRASLMTCLANTLREGGFDRIAAGRAAERLTGRLMELMAELDEYCVLEFHGEIPIDSSRGLEQAVKLALEQQAARMRRHMRALSDQARARIVGAAHAACVVVGQSDLF